VSRAGLEILDLRVASQQLQLERETACQVQVPNRYGIVTTTSGRRGRAVSGAGCSNGEDAKQQKERTKRISLIQQVTLTE